MVTIVIQIVTVIQREITYVTKMFAHVRAQLGILVLIKNVVKNGTFLNLKFLDKLINIIYNKSKHIFIYVRMLIDIAVHRQFTLCI